LNPRLPYISSIVVALIMLFVWGTEFFGGYSGSYLFYKFITVLLAFIAIPVLKRMPYSVLGNVMPIVASLLNSFWSELHRPFYVFAYIQGALAAALLFYIPRRLYQVLIYGGGLGFFLIQLHLRSHGEGWYRRLGLPDYAMVLMIFCVLFDVIHRFFVSEQIFREKATQRFTAIGKNQALIIHHLKGLMSAPTLYLDLIEQKMNQRPDPEMEKLVQALHEDMDRLNRGILELNQLTAQKMSGPEVFLLRDVVEQVRAIMGRKLDGVTIDIHPAESTLCSERSAFVSIFLNAFLNSLQNWQGNFTSERDPLRIDIVLEGRKLKICDNGTGFEVIILKQLKRNEFRSNKPEGSGIGSLLIDTAATQVGGTVKFYNRKDQRGAVVQINLPKAAVQGTVV
jgi:hypothetical protein